MNNNNFFKEIYSAWKRADPFTEGAALSYYMLFSLPAMLVVVIAVATFLLRNHIIEIRVMQHLVSLLGNDAASTIQSVARHVRHSGTGAVANIIGIVTVVIGSIGAFGQLQSVLNKIWNVPDQVTQGVWVFFREKMAAFFMVFFLGLLLVISFITTAIIPFFYSFIESIFPYAAQFIEPVNILVSFVFLVALFMSIYAFLPDTKVKFLAIVYGGFITTMFFIIGKYLIGLYININSIVSTYGTASAIIIILLWAYYVSQVFLIGAACTYAIDQRLKKS